MLNGVGGKVEGSPIEYSEVARDCDHLPGGDDGGADIPAHRRSVEGYAGTGHLCVSGPLVIDVGSRYYCASLDLGIGVYVALALALMFSFDWEVKQNLESIFDALA